MSESTKKILVVDDEQSFLDLVAEFLSTVGLTVDTAADGMEAVHKFNEEDYALVIMDIAMPRLNGVEAIRMIRRKNPDVDIIVVSAYAEGGVIDEVKSAGNCKILTKPVDLKRLGETVKATIG